MGEGRGGEAASGLKAAVGTLALPLGWRECRVLVEERQDGSDGLAETRPAMCQMFLILGC